MSPQLKLLRRPHNGSGGGGRQILEGLEHSYSGSKFAAQSHSSCSAADGHWSHWSSAGTPRANRATMLFLLWVLALPDAPDATLTLFD